MGKNGRNLITYRKFLEKYETNGIAKGKLDRKSLRIGEEISDSLLAEKLFIESIESQVVIYNEKGRELGKINDEKSFDNFFNNTLQSSNILLIDVAGKQYRGEYIASQHNQGKIKIHGSQGFPGLIK